MSVCHHYLRGTCRYGNQCRFTHENPHAPRGPHQQNLPFRPRYQFNPNYNYVAQPTNQNRGASQRDTSKYDAVFKWVKETFADKEKALDILGELQREARVWQKCGHLWRFTSKSLYPGGQPLEGWQDQSFEEISWLYRTFKSQNQEHVYKKAYFDYYENIVRQLNEFAQLKLDRLIAIKDYIRQYVESNYKPSKTLSTDVEMTDVSGDTTIQSFPQTDSANYTPDDQLLEDERTAFQSDTFEFGNIPIHAPPKQFC